MIPNSIEYLFDTEDLFKQNTLLPSELSCRLDTEKNNRIWFKTPRVYLENTNNYNFNIGIRSATKKRANLTVTIRYTLSIVEVPSGYIHDPFNFSYRCWSSNQTVGFSSLTEIMRDLNSAFQRSLQYCVENTKEWFSHKPDLLPGDINISYIYENNQCVVTIDNKNSWQYYNSFPEDRGFKVKYIFTEMNDDAQLFLHGVVLNKLYDTPISFPIPWDFRDIYICSSLSQNDKNNFLLETSEYYISPIKVFKPNSIANEFWIDLYSADDPRVEVDIKTLMKYRIRLRILIQSVLFPRGV